MRRLGFVLVGACGACGDAAFVCNDDADCTASAAGVCQIEGYCSFPDDDCPSGQRYGDHSSTLSGRCVDPGAGTTSSASSGGDTTIASLTSTQPESSDSPATDATVDTTSAVSLSTGETTASSVETGTLDATGSSTSGEPVDPDLLLWLRFEGADEFVNDGVIGDIAVCEQGCPLQDDGIATFDGTDDCLVAPFDEAFASDAFTATAWLWRTDETDDYYFYVFGKAFGERGANSWELFVIPDAELVPVLRAHIAAPVEAIADFPMPPARAWIHVATSWDGATLRLWLDGQPVAEDDAMGVSYDDHPVQIGCDDNGTNQEGQLGGRLHDVRVYARALDEAEIAMLAAEPPARMFPEKPQRASAQVQ